LSSDLNLVSKIHKVGETVVIAICDPELVNRTLTGPRGIKVVAKEEFYGNQTIPPDELMEWLKKATSVNAIGSKSVEFLVKNGYGSRRSIIMIGDVPHLIFMRC
jgi:hypothetical protein